VVIVAFACEGTVDVSVVSEEWWRNLDLNKRLHSGRPVALTCDLNGQKLMNLLNKTIRFLLELYWNG